MAVLPLGTVNLKVGTPIYATFSTACAEFWCFVQCFQQSQASMLQQLIYPRRRNNPETWVSASRRSTGLSLVLFLYPSVFAAPAVWAGGWLHGWSDAGRWPTSTTVTAYTMIQGCSSTLQSRKLSSKNQDLGQDSLKASFQWHRKRQSSWEPRSTSFCW